MTGPTEEKNTSAASATKRHSSVSNFFSATMTMWGLEEVNREIVDFVERARAETGAWHRAELAQQERAVPENFSLVYEMKNAALEVAQSNYWTASVKYKTLMSVFRDTAIQAAKSTTPRSKPTTKTAKAKAPLQTDDLLLIIEDLGYEAKFALASTIYIARESLPPESSRRAEASAMRGEAETLLAKLDKAAPEYPSVCFASLRKSPTP